MIKTIYKNYENSNDEKERIALIKEFENQFTKFSTFVKNNYKTLKHRDISYALSVLSKKKSLDINKILEDKDMEILKSLINSTDAKTRKNIYITLGNIQNPKFKDFLISQTKIEQTYFAIPSLILALGNFNDTLIILEEFKKNLNLNDCPEKIKAEINSAFYKAIDKLSIKNDITFKGFNKTHLFLLTTQKKSKDSLINEIKNNFVYEEVDEGIVVKTNEIEKIFNFRCFYKCLLFDEKLYKIDKNFEKISKNLIKFINNIDFLNIFNNFSTINYRISCNKRNNKEILNFITNTLESNFPFLKNSPSNYNFEIIIQEETDNYSLFINPTFFTDNRYNYRTEDLPASINPTTAAIINKISTQYIKNPKNVLDTFCGTSTMLIEHNFINKNANLFGVDISKTAIEKSKINSNNLNLKINLTVSDILDYKPKTKFDLIISNLPFGTRVGSHNVNKKLYKGFINKLPTFLNSKSYALLYSTEIKLLTDLIDENNDLKLIKRIKLESGNMNPSLFIIKNIS